MRRRLLNLLTVLSLVLCVAIVVLWVSSCWRYVAVSGPVAGRSARMYLCRHSLWLTWTDRPFFRRRVDSGQPFSKGQFSDFFRFRREPPPFRDRSLGGDRPPNMQQVGGETYFVFGFGYEPPWPGARRPEQCTFTSAGIPLWFPTVALGALPAWRLSRGVIARRRTLGGLCPSCGYDLTGNVSGVCPECGAGVE